MPLARINGRVLYFAHIPKTGGTSIEAYLRAKGAVALLQRETGGWSRCTAQHVQRKIAAKLVPAGFYDAGFTIVRDPVSRLMSEYRMRHTLATRGDSARTASPSGLIERLIPQLDPPSFDRWVARAMRAYRRDPYAHDNHLRPQAEFLDPAHRVFRFEHGLDRVCDWIDAVTDTAPANRVHLRKGDGSLAVACSPASEALIREVYAEDYRLIAGLDAAADPVG